MVAHHLSLIAVRAETAPYRLPICPSRSAPSSARSAPRPARRWPTCGACSACCATTSPPSSPRSPSWPTCPCSSTPPARPGCRSNCLVDRPATGPGAGGGRRVRLPDRAGIAVQRQPSRPGRPGHRVPGPCAEGGLLRVANGPGGEPMDPGRGPALRQGGEPPAGHGLTGMRERVACWADRCRPARPRTADSWCPPRLPVSAAGRDPLPDRRRPGPGPGGVRRGTGRPARHPVVGQAPDGAAAVRAARRLRPDVILMDVRMPVMDGLAGARQILSGRRPAPPGRES